MNHQRRSSDPSHEVWFCYECTDGPLNVDVLEHCPNCGQLVSEFCNREWLRPAEDPSRYISPRSREPPPKEALPMTTIGYMPPISSLNGASTLSNDPSGVISNIELTTSPSIPRLLYQDPTTTNTIPNISSDTQSERLAQPGNEITSEPWSSGGCEDGFLQPPIQPFHDSLPLARAISHDDTRSILPQCSLQYSGNHSQVATQLNHERDVNYYSQQTSREIDYSFEGLQRIHSGQLGFMATIGSAYAALNAAYYSTGESSERVLLGCPNVPIDAFGQYAPSRQIQGYLSGPTFSAQAFGHANTTPSYAQLPSLEYDSTEPRVSSNDSHIIVNSAQEVKVTKPSPKEYKCCGAGESQRLACPFYKHGLQVHHKCRDRAFNNISHLSQHLKVAHKAADPPIGGVRVDDLPEFPRTRIGNDNKWYWVYKKLFGDAAELPRCPFSHPISDMEAKLSGLLTQKNIASVGSLFGENTLLSPQLQVCDFEIS
ncbi:hypothetical protein SAMD00023353_0200460 [Rosellinia necatrix]|uniref:Uncharacterized protein n=1 Tax=Rosellinia necatrix TaxID=77044 RepID=A0A1S7UJY2_ROSNE|nr:hypothetical protein SAMD00023353_0200460 [Rosellinia necatrix]